MRDYIEMFLRTPTALTEGREVYCTKDGNVGFKFKGTILGRLIGADMNVTTDQTIAIPYSTNFAVNRILVTNASTSLTTAVGGIYSAASKGGSAIVANTQVYSALTAAGKVVALTIAAAGSGNMFTGNVFFSLTTAQGAAATADIYVIGDDIS
jgi:hypothetical protein